MSGTWPDARAAVKAQVHGVVFTPASQAAQTIEGREYPPPARQNRFPLAYVVPSEQTVTRNPGGERETVVDEVTVRVLLGPIASDNYEALSTARDSCIEALKDAFDDFVGIDGAGDTFLEQRFGRLASFAEDQAWGFEMFLGGMHITELKTFSA